MSEVTQVLVLITLVSAVLAIIWRLFRNIDTLLGLPEDITALKHKIETVADKVDTLAVQMREHRRGHAS